MAAAVTPEAPEPSEPEAGAGALEETDATPEPATPAAEPEPEAAAPATEPPAEGSDDDISLESILEDLRRREGRTD